MTDRTELKRLAREAIRETKPSPVLVTLIVLAILAVMNLLVLNLNGELDMYVTQVTNALQGDFSVVEPTGEISLFAVLLILALNLMSSVVTMGYTLYALRVKRRQSPGIGDVFDTFGMFLRVIVLTILRSLLVSFVYMGPLYLLSAVMDPVLATLFCTPFVIPMLMVAYSYRLAGFILLDNPSFPAIQCLGLSRLAMKGRKSELFTLDVSFLGWILLCIFPPAILWVRPYIAVTNAGYYDAVIPGFMEWLKTQPIPQRPGDPGPGVWNPPSGPDGDSDGDLRDNPGGWSVPGEKREEAPSGEETESEEETDPEEETEPENTDDPEDETDDEA